MVFVGPLFTMIGLKLF